MSGPRDLVLAALNGPAEAIPWRLADLEGTGPDVLAWGQPGVEIVVGAARALVPRAVWYRWVTEALTRLLQDYVRWSGVREHELEAFALGVAMIPEHAAPPDPEDGAAYGRCLMTMANLTTFSALQMRAPGGVAAIPAVVRDACEWAFKRHIKSRRCAHSPASLVAAAADAHAAVAALAGADAEEERETWLEARYADLVGLAREAFAEPASEEDE